MTGLILAAAFFGLSGSPYEDDDHEAVEIGRAVQAVDRLLAYRLPQSPTAADRTKARELRQGAVRAGQLTRVYPWVNARLRLEVDQVRNALQDAEPDPAREQELRDRLDFLTRLIREIDAPR